MVATVLNAFGILSYTCETNTDRTHFTDGNAEAESLGHDLPKSWDSDSGSLTSKSNAHSYEVSITLGAWKRGCHSNFGGLRGSGENGTRLWRTGLFF